MKILVLGGTGAMGSHLVKLLDSQNHEIIVTSRSYRKNENNIEYIQGNAHDTFFLKTLLNRHWDAILDFMVYSTIEFKNRAELLLCATSQYVFLSSARVYANSKKYLAETSPRLLDVSDDDIYLSTDDYSLTKARQEDVLTKSKHSNWTIIRPYITYSENRLQLGVLEKERWLYRALQGRTIVFSSETFTKLTTLTYGLNVAQAIFSLIGRPNAMRNIYHITNNTVYAWSDILTMYLDVLRQHLGYMPKIMLVDETDSRKTSTPTYQELYDRYFDRSFDNSKINEFSPVDDFEDARSGIERCLTFFLKKPEFNQINWVDEAINDRLTREYTSLREIPQLKHKIKYLIFRFLYKY